MLYRLRPPATLEWSEERPHHFTQETDTDGTRALVVRRRVPIPDDLSLLLGEWLYQLRAALDNCLYAVAVVDSGQDPPPYGDRLQWPICTTPEQWASQSRRLAGLSAELVDALEAIQPYNAEMPDWNCLRILHDMARMDRHRTLHLAALFPAEASIRYDADLVTDVEVHRGVIADGTTLVRFRYLGDEPLGPEHIDGDFEFDLEVDAVEESIGPTGKVGRPYGSLEGRLRALFDVTQDYMLGLALLAEDLRTEGTAS